MRPSDLIENGGTTAVDDVDDWIAAGKPPVVYATAYDPDRRRTVFERLSTLGVRFASRIPSGNWIAEDVVFSEGVIAFQPCMILPASVLGRCVIVMPDAAIGHDVALGDFVTVGRAACISGYVSIGAGAVVGAGAVIVNGSAAKLLRVGAGARILDGATVTKDVPDGATVAGNPGRRVRT